MRKIDNPLVSIIIPVYNGADYIADAIKSALSQNYRPIEVIVVDDGSIDDTSAIVKSMISDELFYYYKENGGVSSARNYGLKKTNGKYVKFLDADDFLLSDSLVGQVVHAQTLSEKEISLGCYLSYNEEIRIPQIFSMASYPPWLALYPTSALVEVGGFDTSMKTGEDLELSINLKAHGYRFVVTETIVYKYCCGRNPDSLYLEAMRNPDWENMRYFFCKYLESYKKISSFKEYYRFFIISLFLTGKTSDYLFLRKRLPFWVRPTQICKSRILGYILWYGSYIFPYDKLKNSLENTIPVKMRDWIHSHKL